MELVNIEFLKWTEISGCQMSYSAQTNAGACTHAQREKGRGSVRKRDRYSLPFLLMWSFHCPAHTVSDRSHTCTCSHHYTCGGGVITGSLCVCCHNTRSLTLILIPGLVSQYSIPSRYAILKRYQNTKPQQKKKAY